MRGLNKMIVIWMIAAMMFAAPAEILAADKMPASDMKACNSEQVLNREDYVEPEHPQLSGEMGRDSGEASVPAVEAKGKIAAEGGAEDKASGYYDYDDDYYYDDWYLSVDNLEMRFYPDDYTPWVLYAYGSDLYSIRAVSSNQNVVTIGKVSYEGYYDGEYEYRIELYRQGGGKANVTVYDGYGDSRVCAVTAEGTPYKMNAAYYTFSKKNPYDSTWFRNEYWGKDREIVQAKSSNKKVASVKIAYGEAQVKAKKKGKTTITLTDRSGKVSIIKVTVGKSWKKANLSWNSGGSIYYGNRRIYVYSKPKTKVTLKIGGKKYKKKTNSKGYCYINLKKDYKLYAKYSITFKKKGTKCVKKGKVSSNTSAYKTFT